MVIKWKLYCVNEYRAYAAVEAMQKISELAKEFGLDDMSLEEINAEIVNEVHSAIKKQKESGCQRIPVFNKRKLGFWCRKVQKKGKMVEEKTCSKTI